MWQFYKTFAAIFLLTFLLFLSLSCRTDPADGSQTPLWLGLLTCKFLRRLSFEKGNPACWSAQAPVCNCVTAVRKISLLQRILPGMCPDTGSLSSNFLPRCSGVSEILAQEVKKNNNLAVNSFLETLFGDLLKLVQCFVYINRDCSK